MYNELSSFTPQKLLFFTINFPFTRIIDIDKRQTNGKFFKHWFSKTQQIPITDFHFLNGSNKSYYNTKATSRPWARELVVTMSVVFACLGHSILHSTLGSRNKTGKRKEMDQFHYAIIKPFPYCLLYFTW